MNATQAIKNAAKYQSLGLAIQSLSHMVKPGRIMLGDDGRFWVVTPAAAMVLERAGYEYAI